MKNTDRLEEFVKTHRDEFDNLEPSPDLWVRIQRDTKRIKVVKMQSYLIRVAAVVAVVILSTMLIIDNNFFKKEGTAKVTDPELIELLETEQFYAQQVSGKLDEIRKCYTTFPEIKNDVEADLNELESMYNSLKNDLKDNISNKPVIEAMIENNRYRLKLVDSVLEQIKC